MVHGRNIQLKKEYKNAKRTFLRFSSRIDMATTCSVVIRSFVIISPQAAFAFGKAEFPFYFHPVADIGIFQLSVDDCIFSRFSKRRAGKTNTMLFAVVQARPVPIDFVCQDTFRIAALSSFASTIIVPLFCGDCGLPESSLLS